MSRIRIRKRRLPDVLLALITLIAWVGLFVPGILFGTQPYIDELTKNQGLPLPVILRDLFIIIACYTWTNAGMLCMLASLLGGVMRRARRRRSADRDDGGPDSAWYLSTLLSGFSAYLLVASGILFLGPMQQLLNSSYPAGLDRYIKLACFTSLIGFFSGYNPAFILSTSQGIAGMISQSLVVKGYINGGRSAGERPDSAKRYDRPAEGAVSSGCSVDEGPDTEREPATAPS